MTKEKIQAHIVDIAEQRVISRPVLWQAPSVGDEIRLGERLFFKVETLVWVFDEPECPYAQRLNIGVRRIELKDEG